MNKSFFMNAIFNAITEEFGNKNPFETYDLTQKFDTFLKTYAPHPDQAKAENWDDENEKFWESLNELVWDNVRNAFVVGFDVAQKICK